MTAQQTHEKNLVWIDEEVRFETATGATGGAINSLRANRKVLERHGPDEHWDNVCKACRRANIDQLAVRIDFPCNSYTDITEGLDIK